VAEKLIKKRCVLSIGDYEPVDMAQRFNGFQEELQQFAKTWNVGTTLSPLKMETNDAVAVWQVETTAPNWQVKTEFRILNWSDIVIKDHQRWSPTRVLRAFRALADFVVSGTCWHYVRLNWRFGLLFLYPALAVLLFSAVALAVLLGSFESLFAWLAGLAIAAALFAAFVKWIDPLVLGRVVDMWIFLHELVHLEKTGLAERLGVFIEDIVAQLQSNEFDEIVIVGHGIGAALQPVILDRVFWALPEFGKDGRSISLLSVGSLLLAVGLHPRGAWVVAPALRVSQDKMVYWVEYQAQDDIMNFPGKNPVGELIDDDSKQPVLRNIRVSDMADAEDRFPESIFKNHRRLVEANSKRYFYDYFMICCGPFNLATRAENPDLMVDAFDEDG
jgi:hypothetical protein